jgi:ParB-like chromosome segregation protein Spo0J
MGMMVKLTDIHPHPMNKEIYTISDIDDLVDSIRSKGLLEPIVIDQNFHVISGHRRLTAIAKLEWEDNLFCSHPNNS